VHYGGLLLGRPRLQGRNLNTKANLKAVSSRGAARKPGASVNMRKLSLTGARTKACCLVIHAEASLSHGGQGETLVPPHTRGSVSLAQFIYESSFINSFDSSTQTPGHFQHRIRVAPPHQGRRREVSVSSWTACRWCPGTTAAASIRA